MLSHLKVNLPRSQGLPGADRKRLAEDPAVRPRWGLLPGRHSPRTAAAHWPPGRPERGLRGFLLQTRKFPRRLSPCEGPGLSSALPRGDRLVPHTVFVGGVRKLLTSHRPLAAFQAPRGPQRRGLPEGSCLHRRPLAVPASPVLTAKPRHSDGAGTSPGLPALCPALCPPAGRGPGSRPARAVASPGRCQKRRARTPGCEGGLASAPPSLPGARAAQASALQAQGRTPVSGARLSEPKNLCRPGTAEGLFRDQQSLCIPHRPPPTPALTC